jgi:hypothetical protein
MHTYKGIFFLHMYENVKYISIHIGARKRSLSQKLKASTEIKIDIDQRIGF